MLCLLLVMPFTQQLEIAELICSTTSDIDNVVNISAWITASN